MHDFAIVRSRDSPCLVVLVLDFGASGGKMLQQQKILDLLNSIHEHEIAENLLVPLMTKMGLRGVRYTGARMKQVLILNTMS